MVRIPCPNCDEISYTPDVEGFFPCPRCGFLFSGKYGLDRRKEPRLAKEMPFTFSCQGREFLGRTFDVSPAGIGVEVSGMAPISVSDVLSITLSELGISSAKVVWIKAKNQKSVIGLEKTN